MMFFSPPSNKVNQNLKLITDLLQFFVHHYPWSVGENVSEQPRYLRGDANSDTSNQSHGSNDGPSEHTKMVLGLVISTILVGLCIVACCAAYNGRRDMLENNGESTNCERVLQPCC